MCLFAEPTYRVSARGNRVLEIGSYSYMTDYKQGPKVRWRCIKTRKKCKGSVLTLNDTIVKISKYHNHA